MSPKLSYSPFGSTCSPFTINDCFYRINIFSDSVWSLKSIRLWIKQSYCEGHPKLHRILLLIYRFCFTWCKGHNNILGNEIAEFFAKDSVTNPKCTMQEQLLPISQLKNTVKAKSSEFWLERWSNTENGRNFIPGHVPSHILKNTLSHKVTQILTGHLQIKFLPI